jgi:hypothetical protein
VPSSHSRLQWFLEIALIFAVFTLQGAWPVPDVNEPYYLGKAIHYWNSNAFPGDFFMESADTHQVFCFALGWLSLLLPQTAFAWTGRLVTWFLLAWAWRRLSVAAIPRPWYSLLTAALFGCLMERCHMAGEWVIGGVEAKGFAYVLVFLGLESLLRSRWNRALWLFGGASAFHILVGGWSMVAAAATWLWLSRAKLGVAPADDDSNETMQPAQACPSLRSLWPGILGGFLLAMLGLIPGLMLDWGVARDTLRQAHSIYVFERLPHHLLLSGMRPEFILRMMLLCVVWLLLGRLLPTSAVLRRLRAFVAGALLITCVGAGIHLLLLVDRESAAGLLRYYWFRLTDVAVPLGVSLEVAALIARRFSRTRDPCDHPALLVESSGPLVAFPHGNEAALVYDANGLDTASKADRNERRAGMGKWWLALVVVVVAFHLGDLVMTRLTPQPPRSFKLADEAAWQAACDWIVQSGKIPPHATFITPRMCQTFQWDTGRNEVASWKNVPQDAADLVAWWQRMQDLYATGQPPPSVRWRESLAELGADRLRQLGMIYHADYVIDRTPAQEAQEDAQTQARNAAPSPGNDVIHRAEETPLDLSEIYRNRSYVIYCLR